jgi:NAD(P)-dependent dehydrogenase (short-subunit alcohol dehydrogenase family)
VVFNASVNAIRPERGFLDYNVSKAAVVSIAKSLALELGAEGVAVTQCHVEVRVRRTERVRAGLRFIYGE